MYERIFNEVLTPYLEPRLKRTSLKAVKAYVKSVEVSRKIALAAFGIATAAAILVTGLILIITAIIGLLPISPTAALIVMLAIGVLLAGGAGFMAWSGFREREWLKMSKADALMEAAMKPWETPYSVPDPRAIFAGAPASQRSFDLNRALRGPRVARTPNVASHDAADASAPAAVIPSFVTPDASVATRSIDTTSDLQPPGIEDGRAP